MTKRYLIRADVLRARGTQTLAIEANSADEARTKFDTGEGDVIDEEFEVDTYGALDIQEAAHD